MASLLIGVDIGTQGVKAVLYTAAGRPLANAFRPSRLYRPDAVTVEEDPEFQTGSACQAIRECLREAKADAREVAALAFDGQMAGLIGIAGDGLAATPYDSWLDQRCAPQIAAMERKAGEEILDKTGCPPSFNHGPKILRWREKFRPVYRKIHSFVQPGAYVAMRLCGLDGARAFIDRTYLHFSGFAHNVNCRWDKDLCKRFGVDIAKMPAIVDPCSIVGHAGGELARRAGLREGTPVAAGCGDTAASFLSCGAVCAGVCVDVAGTASVFAATTDQFRTDTQHRVLGCGQAVVPGLWHPYAYINGGGLNLEWLRQDLAAGLGAKAPMELPELNRLASRVKIDESLPLFIPHLGGRVCPSRPALRGAWLGLTWSHGIGELYRAALEGVALEYGLYCQILRELYPRLKLRELRVTGGGEKSAVWNQIKADALGMPVVRIRRSGGAPMGAALVAGCAAGLLKDLPKAADAWAAVGQAQAPDSSQKSYYVRRLERYQAALTMLEQFHSE